MGTLRCDLCREEFFIGHNPPWVDKRVAEKQASGWKRACAAAFLSGSPGVASLQMAHPC